MYDYRESIKHIIDHTENTEHDLANSAYAIHTICDIILSEHVPNKLTVEPTDPAPTEPKIQSAQPTVPLAQPNEVPKSNVAYSKEFIHKIHQIVDANPDIGTYHLFGIMHVGSATIRRFITTNDAITFKHPNQNNFKRAKEVKEKIANGLDLDNDLLLNDTKTITDDQARHAVDPIRQKLHPQTTTPVIEVGPNNKPLTNIKLKQYPTFGKMLTDIRKQSHLTQIEFGKKLNTSGPKMSQIEHGKQSPSIAFVMSLTQLLEISIANLKSHVTPDKPDDKHENATENDQPKFVLTHNTNDKDLIANVLTKPLPMNTYLARRDFDSLKLLNNKGEVVFQTNALNTQTEKINTGDLVSANIVNQHQAHILKIVEHHDLDNYDGIKGAEIVWSAGHFVTYGNQETSLKDINPERSYFSIPDSYAHSHHINIQTTIDILWRKQEPKYITIVKINRPNKTASNH